MRFNRHPQHWHQSLSRNHAGQVSRPTCPGNNHFNSTLFRFACIGVHVLWGPMRTHYTTLMRHAKKREHVVGMTHRLPVRL